MCSAAAGLYSRLPTEFRVRYELFLACSSLKQVEKFCGKKMVADVFGFVDRRGDIASEVEL